ncbi:hypothetical protein DIPPA_53953 [Diplonema papillatum]|nr:hypothetical protein DIPPA_53953 [Diplonema papillatum]|eukprot:gene20289-31224_t
MPRSSIALAFAVAFHGASAVCPFAVVNMSGLDAGLQLATVAAAGLHNTDASRVYCVGTSADVVWAKALLPAECLSPGALISGPAAAASFVNATLAQRVAHGVVLYTESESEISLPPVVTLSGVYRAIPLSGSVYESSFMGAEVLFDSRGKWASQAEGVNYTYHTVLQNTTSLSYQTGDSLRSGGLVDWQISRRLFVHYLNESCVPDTPNNKLFKKIVADAPWAKPVRVYGYNAQDPFLGGDVFEAETDCINDMGQIATTGVTNLAFWEHFGRTFPPGTAALHQPPSPHIAYNASKAYVALVYGDMDNIDFVQTMAREHMVDRAANCSTGRKCWPFTWTMSPNLLEIAPEFIRWYYNTSSATGGQDWFIMPPSGSLYSYPSEMPPDVQKTYVEEQTRQARLMGTNGSIHWEWFYHWEEAWANYFPRYLPTGAGGTVGATTRGFFLNDVPWPIPVPGMILKDENYRVVKPPGVAPANLTDSEFVVGFRPAFNWQAGGGGGINFSPSSIAKTINLFPAGTITYIYIIQNTPIAEVFEAVELLNPTWDGDGGASDSHVQLVGYEQLMSLAKQQYIEKHAP